MFLNILPRAVLLLGNDSFTERGRTTKGDGTNTEIHVNWLTRRQAVAAAAMVLGGLAMLKPAAARAESEVDVSHTSEAIHQEATFKASRKRVYEALTDTRQFDKVVELSGAKQSMAPGSKPT